MFLGVDLEFSKAQVKFRVSIFLLPVDPDVDFSSTMSAFIMHVPYYVDI